MDDKELLRRMKIVSIRYDDVLFSIRHLEKSGDMIIHNQLPEGCIVKAVNMNFLAHCFEFLILHESFPLVVEGCPPPYAEDIQYSTTYRLNDCMLNDESECRWCVHSVCESPWKDDEDLECQYFIKIEG